MQFWGEEGETSFISCSQQSLRVFDSCPADSSELQPERCSTPDPTPPDSFTQARIVGFMVTCAHGIDLAASNRKALTDSGARESEVKYAALQIVTRKTAAAV